MSDDQQNELYYLVALAEVAAAISGGVKNEAAKPTSADLAAFIAYLVPDFRETLSERGPAKWRVSRVNLLKLAADIGAGAERKAAEAKSTRVSLRDIKAVGKVLAPNCKGTVPQDVQELDYCRKVPWPTFES
jgi:hypothetical protein